MPKHIPRLARCHGRNTKMGLSKRFRLDSPIFVGASVALVGLVFAVIGVAIAVA